MIGKIVEYNTMLGNGVGVITSPHEEDGLWNITTKGGKGNIKEDNIVRVFTEQEIALAVYEKYVDQIK